jgi:hypothetical protein
LPAGVIPNTRALEDLDSRFSLVRVDTRLFEFGVRTVDAHRAYIVLFALAHGLVDPRRRLDNGPHLVVSR